MYLLNELFMWNTLHITCMELYYVLEREDRE